MNAVLFVDQANTLHLVYSDSTVEVLRNDMNTWCDPVVVPKEWGNAIEFYTMLGNMEIVEIF